MKAWPQRSASLATRLGLYYSLGLALVVALGSFAVYWTFDAAVERGLRGDLAEKIQQLRRAADDLALKPRDFSRIFFGNSDEDGMVRPQVRITDENRRELFRSKGMKALLGAPFPAPALEGDSRFRVVAWTGGKGRRYRLAAAKLESSPSIGRRYLAELALDATSEMALLRRTRNGLWTGGILGVILAFVLGRALAGRGLKPLSDISQAAISMTPEQMRLRLESQGWSREISELARAFNSMLAKLNDSFERLSQHSAVLSHELRTPLHHLRLHSEVVLARARSAEEYRKALEANLEEIDRLSQTIDSVLFLARATGPREGVKFEEFEAGENMRELAEFYEPAAEKAGVRLRVSGSALLTADRGLCRRALSNLLSNALRHSPPGSEIELRVLAVGDIARFEVADRGPGIPQASLPHIFEPFYRIPGQSPGEGSGLGLAIVRRIVEIHQGKVFLRSAEGDGTRIGFTLPVNGGAAAAE